MPKLNKLIFIAMFIFASNIQASERQGSFGPLEKGDNIWTPEKSDNELVRKFARKNDVYTKMKDPGPWRSIPWSRIDEDIPDRPEGKNNSGALSREEMRRLVEKDWPVKATPKNQRHD